MRRISFLIAQGYGLWASREILYDIPTFLFPSSFGLFGGDFILTMHLSQSINNTMTITSCLAFCASADAQFAGLEYGRECYCSPYLSVLSEKLNETARCNFACNGNTSQICGGMNAITLYNRTQGSTGVAWRLGSTEHGYGVLALVFMLIAAFL